MTTNSLSFRNSTNVIAPIYYLNTSLVFLTRIIDFIVVFIVNVLSNAKEYEEC